MSKFSLHIDENNNAKATTPEENYKTSIRLSPHSTTLIKLPITETINLANGQWTTESELQHIVTTYLYVTADPCILTMWQ